MGKTLALVTTAFWILAVSGIIGVIGGCTSTPPLAEQAKDSSEVQAADAEIDRFSDGDAQYVGFYNNFLYRATILNAQVRGALLRKQNEFYQWDRDKFSGERDKSDRNAGIETTVFLSFFTPERRNDNLSDVKSIWRVYLEAGDRRYQGKVKKLRTPLAEIIALYPYHTRWNTAYEITFPVPTPAIEAQALKLTITGPLGAKTVSFNAAR
jgi:hypothetical protein